MPCFCRPSQIYKFQSTLAFVDVAIVLMQTQKFSMNTHKVTYVTAKVCPLEVLYYNSTTIFYPKLVYAFDFTLYVASH